MTRSCDRAEATRLFEATAANLRFVSVARLRALAKLGIESVEDLLKNYPRRYLDMSAVTTIADASIGDVVTIIGTVDEVDVKHPKPRLDITEASLLDGTGVLMGVWFRQPWIARKLKCGQRVAFSGRIEFNYGFKRMSSPFYEIISTVDDAENQSRGMGRILPIHPTTEGLSTNWMRRLIAGALEDVEGLLDPLPVDLRIEHGLVPRFSALKGIHFPQSEEERIAARKRLAFDEIFYLQLYLMRRRDASFQGRTAFVHEIDGPTLRALRDAVPFSLTAEQSAAIDDILGDMAAPRPMNRMLLGDVGTGKTVVAACALAAAHDSGHQAAMMAPTEVLAKQYGEKVGPLLDEAGVPWGLLTGGTPQKERRELLDRLAAGEVSVLFGTHAILEDEVVFGDLSLTIVDEQHRFGVKQRASLRAKGDGADLLIMTATPIPRSLALALYGDLECSYIRSRPAKRAPVATRVLPKNDRSLAYDAIREAVAEGRQAYIICPLVGVKKPKGDEGEVIDTTADDLEAGVDLASGKAAQTEVGFLRSKVFPELTVGLLTGKMTSKEKASVMEDFRGGAIDVLVSTTVVEVGVDVPNATVMLIEDAERFGLSQLHQLRGRVGRGEYSGQVFLLADPRSDEAIARMKAIESTDDGFSLAEYDLAVRREGDILGSRQHGISSLRLVNIVQDTDLIADAHDDAKRLLEKDPHLAADEYQPLRREVDRLFAELDDAVSGG